MPFCLTLFIESHVLTTPVAATPTALGLTCKEAYALMKENMRVRKWTAFYPKFLVQLDFVDRFKYRNTRDQRESDTVYFSTVGTHLRMVSASVVRDWDFARETVTVRVNAVTPAPSYPGSAEEIEQFPVEKAMWKQWEFRYTYDLASTPQANYDNIINQLLQAAMAHRQAYRT
jgi:hypothetical protein